MFLYFILYECPHLKLVINLIVVIFILTTKLQYVLVEVIKVRLQFSLDPFHPSREPRSTFGDIIANRDRLVQLTDGDYVSDGQMICSYILVVL